MSQPRILVITTGGTIDSEPYPPDRKPEITISLAKSAVADLLKTLDGGDKCDCREFSIIRDSKLFASEDLQLLANEIADSSHEYIIITHGTDAMVKNAKTIRDELKDSGKTVIFTGAMQPLLNGPASDGQENLQFSLNKIRQLKPGVYIIGREETGPGIFSPGLFDIDNVKKDFNRLVFIRQDKKNISNSNA